MTKPVPGALQDDLRRDGAVTLGSAAARCCWIRNVPWWRDLRLQAISCTLDESFCVRVVEDVSLIELEARNSLQRFRWL